MSQLSGLVSRVAGLPAERARKVAAFVGAVVGDAACVHLEWIYDQAQVVQIVGGREQEPAFWPDSHCPFFSLPSGSVSCYSDEAVQALTVMADNGGKLDDHQLAQHFCTYFGDPDSPYQIAKAKRAAKKYPIEGPWIQGTLIKMIENYRSGVFPPGPADAADHDGLCTALPLILQQAPGLDTARLRACFRLVSSDDSALLHYEAEAFLLNEYIKGTEDPVQALRYQYARDRTLAGEIDAVVAGLQTAQSAEELVAAFGMACPLPGCFQSSLVSLVSLIDAESYPAAITQTIFCAGDSCSRANLIGACLGAKFGIQGIPHDWMAKVNGIETIIEQCIKVFE